MSPKIKDFIYLFDIDGTLLRVRENTIRPLLQEVLDAFEIPFPNVETVSLAGRTDCDIFNSFIDGHKDQPSLFENVRDEYIHRLTEFLTGDHVEVFEGVNECLHKLSDFGSHIGLLTGNFKQSGYSKLRAAGIAEYFDFGGFGELHRDRNQLPEVAFNSYREYHEQEAEPHQFVVIGDTPKDILCAQYSGAKAVAITTGYYSREQLAAYNPDLIIDSMGNPEEWVLELV